MPLIFLAFSLLTGYSAEGKTDSLIFPKKDYWFSEDKFHHFAHSAAISSSIYLIANNITGKDDNTSFYISFSISSLIGLSKEIKDSNDEKGTASSKDLIFDIAGVLFGILLVSIGGP
ncbi:MAG: hypothetical protein P8Z50_08140 [candidate division WOR-3 bacterium]|jgi:uncharacterized protein YfiM (DUF2279 family)